MDRLLPFGHVQALDDLDSMASLKGDAGTRSFYDDNASSYAAATRSADLSDLTADFATRLYPGDRVLDLGSGSGRDLRSFHALGMAPVGLDVSSNMAAEARRYAPVPVVVADMVALPFADGVFGGVWASASLHHLDAAGQVDALAEARRVLRSSGLLFASMKRGVGAARESTGRAFSYVEADVWGDRIRSAGFELLDIASHEEARAGGSVSWLTCLGRAA